MQSMDYGSISLVFLQIVVVIANAVVYVRQKGQGDAGKHDIESFRSVVNSAFSMATEAKQDVKLINAEQYEVVANKCKELMIELQDAKARIKCLQETVDSLSNKLASRERADKKATKGKDIEEEEVTQVPGQVTLEDLIRSGQALPLNGSAPVEPVQPRSSFGKVAR